MRFRANLRPMWRSVRSRPHSPSSPGLQCDEVSYLTMVDIVGQTKAVIDCGATRTVGPSHALEQVMQENMKKCGSTKLKELDLSERPIFNFGNSSGNQCSSTVRFAVPMNGSEAQVRIHALNTDSGPVLLSVRWLAQLGAQIDFGSGLAVFP